MQARQKDPRNVLKPDAERLEMAPPVSIAPPVSNIASLEGKHGIMPRQVSTRNQKIANTALGNRSLRLRALEMTAQSFSKSIMPGLGRVGAMTFAAKMTGLKKDVRTK